VKEHLVYTQINTRDATGMIDAPLRFKFLWDLLHNFNLVNQAILGLLRSQSKQDAFAAAKTLFQHAHFGGQAGPLFDK